MRRRVSRPKRSCRRSCKFFVDNDCSMAEINPLVVTGDGELLALDAKVTFDDNAMFRHKNFAELRDLQRRGAGRSARPGRRG